MCAVHPKYFCQDEPPGACFNLSALECTCTCVILHAMCIRLSPFLSAMQATVSAGGACMNRQTESTAALNFIHWNVCINKGAIAQA